MTISKFPQILNPKSFYFCQPVQVGLTAFIVNLTTTQNKTEYKGNYWIDGLSNATDIRWSWGGNYEFVIFTFFMSVLTINKSFWWIETFHWSFVYDCTIVYIYMAIVGHMQCISNHAGTHWRSSKKLEEMCDLFKI